MINDRKHQTARITLDLPQVNINGKMWDAVPHGSEPIDPEQPVVPEPGMSSNEWGVVIVAASVILAVLCLILGSLIRFGG